MINKLIGGLLILLSLVTQTGCDSSKAGLTHQALAYCLVRLYSVLLKQDTAA